MSEQKIDLEQSGDGAVQIGSVNNGAIVNINHASRAETKCCHSILSACAIGIDLLFRSLLDKKDLHNSSKPKLIELRDEMLEKHYITCSEYYQLTNFKKIAEKADSIGNMLDENTADFDQEFDLDWFIRFFDAASKISNEELQELWARVLRGEFESKGSFSLRTIETLRNMSREVYRKTQLGGSVNGSVMAKSAFRSVGFSATNVAKTAS